MSRTIHYGYTVSISIPGDTSGRVVAAAPDGSVILASPNQAGERKWVLINETEPESTSPIMSTDTFYIKSAGDAGYIFVEDQKTAMTKTLAAKQGQAAWETGLNPTADSPLIKSGQSILIASWGAASLTPDSEMWVLTCEYPMVGSPLRYGNEVFICAQPTDDAVVADTTNPVAGTDMYAITSDRIWRKRQPWIVSNFDARDSVGPMNFGDRLLFTVDAPTPGPRYLSCRRDIDAALGDKAVTASSFPGEWEAWKVLDPNDTSSRRQIQVGDTLLLQNMDPTYYLSSRQDAPPNPAMTARVAGPAGDTEKWVFSPLLPESDPVSGTVQDLPTPSDNSAASLTLGMDVGESLAIGVVEGLASLMPEGGGIVGGVLGGLIGYFYPSSGEDIWSIIKSHVEALVKEEIQDDKIQTFKDTLDGIKATLQEYVALTDPIRKGTDLQSILNALTSLKSQEKEIEASQRALPYVVILGCLHISALQEMYLHGPQYFGNSGDSALDRKNLKDEIRYYSDRVTARKNGALDWRKTLFSTGVGQADGGPYLIDNYRKNADDALLYLQSDKFDWYKEKVVEIFSQQLEAFMIPSYLWRYIDPDCKDIPMKRRAFAVTGPFGAGNSGEVFFYDPQFGTIAEINVSTGDFVCGTTAIYTSGAIVWNGARCTDHSLQVPFDMKIVKANGFEGDQLNAMWLSTDKLTLGGGSQTGTAWNAAPPPGDAFLVGLSGNASQTQTTEGGETPGRVRTLFLHWEYSRWE